MKYVDGDGSVVLTVVLFAFVFVVLGVVLPQFVTIYAPSGHFVEIEDVEAYNTTTEAELYSVKVNQTVKQETDGTILLELMRVSNGTPEQVAVYYSPHYFPEASGEVYYLRSLPDNLEEGRYYWVVHLQLDYGGAQRTVVEQSNTFTVDNVSTSSTPSSRAGFPWADTAPEPPDEHS